MGSNGERVRVEGEYINAVGIVLNETTNCDTLVGRDKGGGGREGHGVERVGGVICHSVFGSEVGFLGGIIHFL